MASLLLFYILLGLPLALIVGLIGSKRKIGFAGAFFASILLSPIIGIIFVFASKRLSDIEFEKNILNVHKQEKASLDSNSSKNSNTNKFVEDIQKLNELLERGIINKDDFEKIKANLINNIDVSSSISTEANSDEVEYLPMIIYSTNQGDIYIRQTGNQPSVGDKVFTVNKRYHYDVTLKIKNGPRIRVASGKISEIL